MIQHGKAKAPGCGLSTPSYPATSFAPWTAGSDQFERIYGRRTTQKINSTRGRRKSNRCPCACEADLNVNSNALERLGFPRLPISNVLYAAPKGGFVFLEVPCESPFGLASIFRRLAQIGMMTLTYPSLAEFIVRPATLYLMHECISLVLFSGCEVLAAFIPYQQKQGAPQW